MVPTGAPAATAASPHAQPASDCGDDVRAASGAIVASAATRGPLRRYGRCLKAPEPAPLAG